MAGLGRIWRGKIGRLSAAMLFAAVSLGAQPASAVERKLLIASFENIQVIGDINVTVQTGKSPSAIASGDKRVLESLKLERVGMTLRIRLQDIVNNNKGVPITQPLQVTLTTQAIKDITLSGNGTLKVSQVKQPKLTRMLIAGNGSVSIGSLIAEGWDRQYQRKRQNRNRQRRDARCTRDHRRCRHFSRRGRKNAQAAA